MVMTNHDQQCVQIVRPVSLNQTGMLFGVVVVGGGGSCVVWGRKVLDSGNLVLPFSLLYIICKCT